ncbi:MAG: hypothetical protein AAF216_07355 [Pseudomonadota bacterium]
MDNKDNAPKPDQPSLPALPDDEQDIAELVIRMFGDHAATQEAVIGEDGTATEHDASLIPGLSHGAASDVGATPAWPPTSPVKVAASAVAAAPKLTAPLPKLPTVPPISSGLGVTPRPPSTAMVPKPTVIHAQLVEEVFGEEKLNWKTPTALSLMAAAGLGVSGIALWFGFSSSDRGANGLTEPSRAAADVTYSDVMTAVPTPLQRDVPMPTINESVAPALPAPVPALNTDPLQARELAQSPAPEHVVEPPEPVFPVGVPVQSAEPAAQTILARTVVTESVRVETPVPRVSERVHVAPPSPASSSPSPPARKPGRIPSHTFAGVIHPGSAADVIVRTVEASGETLTRAEKFDLAASIERALESELDGRRVTLETPDGETVRVRMTGSQQTSQAMTVSRADEVGRLSNRLVVDGGWYAARDTIVVRPLPDISTEITLGEIERGQLLQRMATLSSPYDDRWYLVGRNGVGFGYVSAGDVTPAAIHDGPLGTVYEIAHGPETRDLVSAATTCRDFEISMEQVAPQRAVVCRGADGHWGAKGAAGPAAPALTALSESLGERLGGLAAAPEEQAALTNSLNALLDQELDGRRVQTGWTDGQKLDVRLDRSRGEVRTLTVPRAAEVGRLPDALRIERGWMEVTRETTLRPTPSLNARMTIDSLQTGAKIEKMGLVTDHYGTRWALVGRHGVGYGYIQLGDLKQITTEPGHRFTGYSRGHGRVVRDVVTASTTCRDISYSVGGSSRRPIAACQGADGQWVVETEAIIPSGQQGQARYAEV